jgi:serine/threonine-protein kinase
LEHVEKQLASTRVALIAGRLASARADADAVVRQAEDVGYRPTLAEAKLLRAGLRRNLGDIANAEHDAKQALWTAQAARADRITARAWLELVAITGQRGQYAEALARAEHADAAIARIDGPPALRAQSLVQQGIAYTNLGKLTAAHTALTRALVLQEHLYGDTHVYVARTLTALGNLERARGHYEAALKLHRRALASDETLLGRDHPSLARHHHNVAGVLRALGRSADALASYERALALEKQHLGIEHVATGLTLNSIGLIRLQAGDLDKAEQAFTESARVLARAEHPDRALALENLGIVAARRDEPKQALAHFDAALAIVEPALGENHERVAELLVEKAESASTLRDRKTAKAAYQRALHIAREHADESKRAQALTIKIESALKLKSATSAGGTDEGKSGGAPVKRPARGAYGPAQTFDQF